MDNSDSARKFSGPLRTGSAHERTINGGRGFVKCTDGLNIAKYHANINNNV